MQHQRSGRKSRRLLGGIKEEEEGEEEVEEGGV